MSDHHDETQTQIDLVDLEAWIVAVVVREIKRADIGPVTIGGHRWEPESP